VRDVLAELLESLELERIEENLFRGQSQNLGWGRIYGGQVLGQALSAARQTVPDDRYVHSLHAYFLRTGDTEHPVVYTVDPIRDGRSFNTRRVVAIQHGKAIFNLSASFQVREEGFEHQIPQLAEAPAPDGLMSERELGTRFLARLPEAVLAQVPPAMKERAVSRRPIEIRPLSPLNPIAPDVRPPRRQCWFKASGPMPDDLAVHQYLLAYASDFHFLVTSLQPHGVSWLTPGVQLASLDHAMYFHRPFRFDDWLLYDIESDTASGARGLVRGRFFDRAGALVATTTQEGLIRDRRSEKGAHRR